LISQSGSVANFLYILGAERAVMFSKMVSSGNELDLNCADFLEYFADDPDTGMILMYLEEVRDPRRFLRAALSVRGKKPLIVWKAGLTKGGRQAAVSHTGAAAGSEAVWNAVVRQAGIVPVEDLADIVDVASLFYHLGKPGGRGVCIISPPGGIAVNSADMVERNGLVMSALSESTVERLREILPGEGTSIRNPVDMGFGAVIPGNLYEALKAVAVDDCVDIIMVVGGAPASRKGDVGLMKMHTGEIKEAMKVIDKPMILIGIPSGWAFPFISEMSWAGIPGFLSPGAACRAVSRFVSYYGL
jgi:acetyltransferase